MMIVDGQLNAMRNRTNSQVFDKRGGWADNFSVDLQAVVDPGAHPGWNGASWVMERSRTFIDGSEVPSYEAFVADVINNAKHNTGDANCQVATYLQGTDPGDDFDETISASAAFGLALADETKKPYALERVPVTDPGP